MNPSHAPAASTAISPVSSASALAVAAYLAGFPAASGPITAAVINAVVASGPSDSDRDEPMTA